MDGADMLFYVRTAGSFGSPTWTAADNVDDETFNLKPTETPANVKADPFDAAEPTTFQLDITGTMKIDPANTVYAFLDAAFLAKTEIDVMVVTGKRTDDGATGYRFGAKLFDWSEPRGRTATGYKNFMLKPAPSANPRMSISVAVEDDTPTITYTAITA